MTTARSDFRGTLAYPAQRARPVPRYVSAFEKMSLAPAFILILVVLLVRPEGIFGQRKVSRV